MNSRPTLYILDDDEQYANLLVEIATTAGWHAISEQSAKAFLNSDISENSVLVLDLIMPEMDGIEVIRALAQKNLNLLLILISGFDSRVLHSAQQLAEAHNIKVLTNLTKPVPAQKFITVLDAIDIDKYSSTNKIDHKSPILVKELEKAIRQHSLILHYQPQLNMKTGALQGVEALVRWHHPTRGLVFPDQFIPLAEDNDLIGILTEEVITMAVEQIQNWQIAGFDTVVSVNVSAENITSLRLPEQLKELTDKHTIDPKMIQLEITESAVMSKLTDSLDVLNRLRMKGFSLSIDDFGTGYSSLSHLYQAPFTELKIDQQFVMRMLKDNEAMVIVKICIMLGQMLGMTTVAEGVETNKHWDKLQELGCDIAQGYLVAKPMPASDLLQWELNRDQEQFG
jgi:EAL domain-containing protein (putative c-di-GMP-specific phosphodiesterase class I)